MDEKWRTIVHQKLEQFVVEFLASKNAQGHLCITKGYPSLQNDEALTKRSMQSAADYLGTDNVEEIDIRMTAEDFSFYSQKIPACFFRLGVRNQDLGISYGVHHPKFDIDKNALKIGAGLMAHLALKALD